MNARELYSSIKKADNAGLNLPLFLALLAVHVKPRTQEEAKKYAGSHAWKCITASPLFDLVDGVAYLSEKGEYTIRRILS